GWKLVTVAAQPVDIASLPHLAGGLWACREICEVPAMDGTKSFGNEHLKWLADHFGPAVATNVLGALVGNGNFLPRVDRDDRVGGYGNDAGELCFGKLQRVLGTFTLRDVFDLRDEVQRGAVAAAKNGHSELHVDRRPVLSDVALLHLVARDV